ncbi:MAG: POTRA domain-containing protein, partial [Thermoanaerobaculia bacterium]|nr:POTRA domain-containing protein [Thermoanaerobaculia bacterium]
MKPAALWLLTVAMILPGLVMGEEGPVVERVEIRSRSPLEEPERIRELVEIVPGEPLAEEGIRDTLRSLYATGLATEIEVWTRPVSGQEVVAMIALRPRVRIVAVRLEGEPGLDRKDLRELVEPKVGQPLIESRVLRTVFRLQDRYEEEGYLEASVRPSIETDPDTREAVVVFRLESGPRATVGEIDLQGDLGEFDREELRSRSKLEPGARYRRESVQEGVDRLLRWLRGEGYRKAEVELAETTYDPGTNAVDVALDVTVGPEVRVRILGADRESLRRKGFLPFLEEEGYDEILVLQAMERVRRHFQEQGHYRVEVEREERRVGDSLLLILRIDPGPVYRLTELEFRGNEGLSDDRLQELMTTAPRRLLVPGSGRLVEATLEEDLDNIRSFYALRGWNRVQVGPPRIQELGGRELKLTVPIDEGPRSRLVGL